MILPGQFGELFVQLLTGAAVDRGLIRESRIPPDLRAQPVHTEALDILLKQRRLCDGDHLDILQISILFELRIERLEIRIRHDARQDLHLLRLQIPDDIREVLLPRKICARIISGIPLAFHIIRQGVDHRRSFRIVRMHHAHTVIGRCLIPCFHEAVQLGSNIKSGMERILMSLDRPGFIRCIDGKAHNALPLADLRDRHGCIGCFGCDHDIDVLIIDQLLCRLPRHLRIRLGIRGDQTDLRALSINGESFFVHLVHYIVRPLFRVLSKGSQNPGLRIDKSHFYNNIGTLSAIRIVLLILPAGNQTQDQHQSRNDCNPSINLFHICLLLSYCPSVDRKSSTSFSSFSMPFCFR